MPSTCNDMTNTSTNNNDDEALLSWDDICVNPHESHLQEGRIEGREAGLAQGYRDGYSLGKSKALEFGMELGFIHGFVRVVSNSGKTHSDRVQTNLQELARSIEKFPSPDKMFADTKASSSSRDVLEKMQRIRAKFKLLTVQLKMPHFSLKQVMKNAAAAKAESEKQTDSGPESATAAFDEKRTVSKVSSSDVSSDW